MNSFTLTELIPVLQNAIGPAILVSGISLFLLMTTNRYGRVIDRVRNLASLKLLENDRKISKIKKQLKILWIRARILRATITSASIGLLSTTFMIIMLFYGSITNANIAGVIMLFFVFCIICLALAVILLIWDSNQSLRALKLELDHCKEWSD
ncbi:MAG: DUF2721 domain-containing protein [Candidatus Delongbacteria bacterium]|jgi:hypothetical protein|nr:DUF2721 domain-containing protein [Candidatus Delongbacteria bacterium]